MKITDVKVRKIFKEGPLKAVVSIVFDDCLAVHDIKVVQTPDKTFVTMPTTKRADGTFRDTVHPINAELRAEITTAAVTAYEVQKAIEDAAEV